MGLNIKSDEVQVLARTLAAETGETLTGAIKVALKERLARLRRERNVEEKRRAIREILDALPPVPPGVTSDHSDFYDEWGLPK